MGTILVTGIRESGKDEIIDMVLTGSRKNLPPFDYFKFNDLLPHGSGDSHGFDLWSFNDRIQRMHNIQRDFHTKLKKKIDHMKLSENHIIVNGCFTVKTSGGYLPLISKGSEKFFKPDLIVVLEVELKNPVMIKKLGKEKVEELKYEQRLNLKYATNYSVLTSSAINVVRVEYGNVKEALKDMNDIVTLALG
jgi:adenylate kinase